MLHAFEALELKLIRRTETALVSLSELPTRVDRMERAVRMIVALFAPTGDKTTLTYRETLKMCAFDPDRRRALGSLSRLVPGLGMLLCPKDIKRVFDDADVQHCGKVSASELFVFCNRQSDIRQLRQEMVKKMF